MKENKKKGLPVKTEPKPQLNYSIKRKKMKAIIRRAAYIVPVVIAVMAIGYLIVRHHNNINDPNFMETVPPCIEANNEN